MRVVLITCITLLLSTVFADDPADRARFYRYEDAFAGFTMEVPMNWEILDNSAAIFLAAAPKGATFQRFRPNLNVIFDLLQEPATLEELFNANVRHAQKVLGNFQVHAIDEVSLDGIPAQRMLYSCRLRLRNSSFDVKNTVYCLLYENRFYIITCSTLDEQFDEYERLLRLMAQSFRIR